MRVLFLLIAVLLSSGLTGCKTEIGGSNSPHPYSHYVRRSNADTVIVFVHGIFGDAASTWTNANTHAYWPELVTNDTAFRSADVYVYSYQSPYLSSSSSIDELVEQMNLTLAADEVFVKHKHVVFVCHSMGGLVTRKLITRYQHLATQIPMIYFFSTPTTGADVTRLAHVLSRNPQLADMLPSEADRYVDVLQRDWRSANFHIVSHCAYEEDKTDGVRIVDPTSASMLCDGPVLPLERDHIAIVKPSDTQDLAYVAFRQAFSELPSAMLSASAVDQPANPSTREETLVRMASHPIAVQCGHTAETTLSVPLPDSLQPGERIVDAVVSIQQGSNIKRHTIDLVGRSNVSADVHYVLAGLDPSGGVCTTDGSGTLVVAFVLARAPTIAPTVTTQVRQATSGDQSPAIYGVTGNITIVREGGFGTAAPAQTEPQSPMALSLATVPQFQGIFLDQKTRGALSPAIAAVGGSVSIVDRSSAPKHK